ncbi:hypothetical protein CHU95_18530 [Niveispirillum lacus]|uniref:Uncharacterized protein n=1 Tax=Niveispirillum lacus TaxID=1981099 RepID=A0A255YU69_9PROT|nr:glycosyltransferase family 39 protein [Niveispirillum lacus]OYQ32752.1 hypothetical protein CHU95_18530 [Niveispirillum lacus]
MGTQPDAASTSSFWDGVAQMALAISVLFVAFTFKNYGITWDEPLHLENGWRALDWYLSLGADQRVLDFQNLYLYGALYDTLTAAAGAILPFDVYESRRLIGGLVGVVGLVAVRAQARMLAGPRAGALAVLLLLLTPEWLGQAFANPKDVPFATAAAWMGLLQIRLIRALPHQRWGSLAAFGLAFGAALGIRVGGVVLIGPLVIACLYWLTLHLRTVPTATALRDACIAAVRLLASFILAWLIMLACWPWAQLDPLTRPLEALAGFSHFPLSFNFPFAGQILSTTDLPWWYVPVAFGVKLPEVTLLGLAVALVMAIRAATRAPLSLPPERVGLTAAILLPPLIVIVTGAVLYDGIRHLLFLLPPLSVAAGIGLDRLATRLGAPAFRERFSHGAGVAAALLCLWIGWQGLTMARLHPYEAIWYNALTGGVRGAQGKFELDYWGSPLSEAAERLRNRIVAQEGSGAIARPYRVRICGPHDSALHFLPPTWKAPADGQGEADFYIAFKRSTCGPVPAGPEIVRVERLGVTLAYVLDLRGGR